MSRNGISGQDLSLDYFGWKISFVPDMDISGKYGQEVAKRNLVRCWDFDLPEKDGTVFRGFARRFVNTFVPHFDDSDLATRDKYGEGKGDVEIDGIKSLQHVACEDRRMLDDGKWLGEIALVTLKGDVDNLGMLFQQGLEKPTFAKWASLSRQMNHFFSLWLPWFCEYGMDGRGVQRYRNTYTVFAGGDDFFLIGPWKSTIEFAGKIRRYFSDYVVNEGITFSAGLSMTKPKVPARHLSALAESALDKSKQRNKNAATLWNQTIGWGDWKELMIDRAKNLEALLEKAREHGAPLSSGMVYSLLELADKAERDQAGRDDRRPEDSLWRSQLYYRTTRLIRDRIRGGEDSEALRRDLHMEVCGEIADSLQKFRGKYRLPLSVLLYTRRE